MNKELKPYYLPIKELVEQHIIGVINQHLNRQKELVVSAKAKLDAIATKSSDNPENLKLYAVFKSEMIEITKGLSEAAFNDLNTEFEFFNQSFDAYFTSLPERIIREQSPERFKNQKTDGYLIKFLKPIKRVLFWISKTPLKVSNSIKTVRKRPTTPVKYWQHSVKLRALIQYFLRAQLFPSIVKEMEGYYKCITNSALVIWEEDISIDKLFAAHITEADADASIKYNSATLTENINVITLFQEHIATSILNDFEAQWEIVDARFLTAGTFEFLSNAYSPSKSDQLINKVVKNYTPINQGWKNTLNGLIDDWEIDLELYHLVFNSFYNFHKAKKKIKSSIDKKIFDQLNQVESFLSDIKKKVSSNKSNLKLLLEEELRNINTALNKLIQVSNEFILDQELAEIINTIETSIVASLEKVSTKRAIIKGSDFTTPSKSSQVSFISPNELINYECAPLLFKRTGSVKINILSHIQKTQTTLDQLVDIAAFNIGSAISVLVDDKAEVEKSRKIAEEGIERSIEQLNKAKSNLLNIEKELDENLLLGLKSFSDDLIKFTNNENIIELRMRIATGKAAEKGRVLKARALTIIKNFTPIVIYKVRNGYKKLETFVTTNIKRLGIVISQETITTELSDFLAESEKSIKDLPFVYQRLFRVLPLEDASFFEGRRKEINKLINAYNQWTNGRVSATIVTGEKGVGLTSLLNLFLEELGSSCEIVRITSVKNLGTEAEFYQLFGLALNSKDLSFDKLVTNLNEGPKKIIIVENLQNFYLKRVGGFTNIKLLTELISLTRQKVHWVVGCTQYAYNYLEKTINISEHFGYNIPLEDLSFEEIVKIIEKRHAVSGYNLIFEPRPEDINNKKYKTLDEVGKQDYLKKAYFSQLNKIAKSNISIALIYWLRSTKHHNDDTIYIGSISNMDFSFMKTLSNQKLFLLTMLLLNDGLTEEEMMRATNYSVQKNRGIIYPLFEDGILIKKEELFFINPLLYRQTVNLLMSKNIIH